jgi:hypothetical protein
MRVAITGVCLWFPHIGRVPHISLVFREMWDTTALSLWLSKPGGLLIAYTDGISEAMTAEDEELGRLGCSKLCHAGLLLWQQKLWSKSSARPTSSLPERSSTTT